MFAALVAMLCAVLLLLDISWRMLAGVVALMWANNVIIGDRVVDLIRAAREPRR